MYSPPVRHIAAPLLLLLLASVCTAQESTLRPERWRLGGYASAQFLGYSVDIAGLPGIPSCCPEYTGGRGDGLAIGLTSEARILPELDPRFGVGGRLLLSMYSSTLTAEERQLVTASDRDTTTALFGHTIETTQPALGVELYAAYEAAPRLALIGGGRIDLMLGGSYHQKEEILAPETIRFENDRRTRMIYDGSIPEENPLHLAAVVGMRYDIPLNNDNTLFLSPEIVVWQGFSNLITNDTWTMRGIRLGVNCSFVRRDGPASPTPLNPSAR